MTILADPVDNSKPHHEPTVRWWAAGSLLLALVAALPLFLNFGFLNTRGGGDSPFLLFRLHQLYTSLIQGVFPVRWMPDAAFGLGYPFFSYYAALPYYFAAVLKMYGFSYVASLKLTQLVGFLIAAGGMYEWIRRVTGSARAGFVAAAAYTFAPFHMVNVYVRGDSLSEFWAMAWYPLIMLAISEVARQASGRRIALLALAYGALAMTHNVSALIFSPFVAIYALASVAANSALPDGQRRNQIARLVNLVAGGVLGLALAAWVWLPALAEKDFVQLDTQTSGYLFYGNHFRAANLVQPGFLFDYDIGSQVTTPFSMGLLQAILLIAGAVGLTVWMVRRKAWRTGGFLLGGLMVSTLMITPLSAPVWERIPLLAFAQFPWRFLSVQAVFGAAAIAYLIPAAWSQPLLTSEKWSRASNLSQQSWSVILPVALAAVMAVAAIGALRLNFIPLNDTDMTPTRLQWYEAFSGNIGTTIRYEYLPKWTYPRPYTSDILLQREPRAKFLVGAGSARREEVNAASQIWDIEVEDSAQIAIPLLYWPGWRAEIDGGEVPVRPVEGIGYILLDVPSGHHSLRLWLGRTGVRLWAEIASLGALITILFLLRPRALRWNWVTRMFAAAGILTLIVPSMILRSLPEHKPLPGPLNADFPQEAYFYHSESIIFTNGASLYDASVNTGLYESTPAGRVWGTGVHLFWQQQGHHYRDGDWDVRVELSPPFQQGQQGAPSIPLSWVRELWLGEHLTHPEVFEFAAATQREPPFLTPGLYFPEIRVLSTHNTDENIEAVEQWSQTSTGSLRGTLALTPVIIPARITDSIPANAQVVNADFSFASLKSTLTENSGSALLVRLWWEVYREAPQNYAIALRLYDESGAEWAALDTQAGGAGMYPTGLWMPGEIVSDGYQLVLPEGTPPGIYSMQVTLYDARTVSPIGQTEIAGIDYSEVSAYSCQQPAPTHLANSIGISQMEIPDSIEQGGQLPVEVGWVAERTPDQDYQIEWRLYNNSEEVWQITTALAPGSSPRTWVAAGCGAYVLGRHSLDIPGSLSPGEYTLVGQLVSESGTPLGEPHSGGQVTITGRDRSFEVPPMTASVGVTFGDQIELWGYTLNQSTDSLILNVVWGSLVDPAQDYKYFVHLFDPANNEIVAQVDSMPRGYTYPTSQWIKGEVVTETIIFDLSNVPPGQYRIAIGWYDPATETRLPATDLAGLELPDQRVILPETIEIP